MNIGRHNGNNGNRGNTYRSNHHGRGSGSGRGGGRGGHGGNTGKKVCYFHIVGKCNKGTDCTFSHDISLMACEHAHSAPIKGLVVLADGTFYTGSADKLLSQWSWNSASNSLSKNGSSTLAGEIKHIEVVENFIIWSMDVSSDQFPGETVGQVHAMNITDSKTFELQLSEKRPYTHPMSVLQFIVRMMDGDLHFITGGLEGNIHIWTLSAATGIVSHVTALEGHIRGVTCMVLQGSMLWSGSMDNSICVWNMATVQMVGSVTSATDGHIEAVTCMTLVNTPTDGEFVVSGSVDCSVKVWLPNGKLHYSTDEGTVVTALASAEDGYGGIVVLVGLSDGKIIIRSWKCLDDLIVLDQHVRHRGEVWCIKSCFPGVVATGGADGKVIVWTAQQSLFP
mmetsp:Transcript_7472/g.11100  ORF Transcript_7472/g.11100 Transcript_7472/m.11100 type:complete len:394 (+) Transcript_7472:75-1256(+)